MPPRNDIIKRESNAAFRFLTGTGMTLAGILVAGFLGGCGKSEPQYYEIEKVQEEAPAAQAVADEHAGHDHAAGMPHDHPEVTSGIGINFSLPEGWTAKQPGSMVLASFQAGQPPQLLADVAVSAFPGDVGGILANINRWRRQVGLEPMDEEAAKAAIRELQISGLPAWQVDFTGPAARVVVSAVFNEGKTWFIKMSGPDSAVEGQLVSYGAFIDSLQF